MVKKKLQCPVCSKVNEVELPEEKLIYRCPSCKLTVRCMPPQEIEVPEMKSKSEAKRIKVQVENAQDIPEEVKKQVAKKAQEVLTKKKTTKKKTTRKKRTTRKKKSDK